MDSTFSCLIQKEEAKQTHLLNSPSGLSTFPVFHKSFKFYGTQWDKERIAPYVTRPGRHPGACQCHSALALAAGSKINASNSSVPQRTSKTASLCPGTWDLPVLNLHLPVDPWAPTKVLPFEPRTSLSCGIFKILLSFFFYTQVYKPPNIFICLLAFNYTNCQKVLLLVQKKMLAVV